MKSLKQYVLDDPRFLLLTLELENCKIKDKGAKHLAQALEGYSQLRFLNISNNEIKEKGAEYLAHSLKVNTTLAVLFLHWNPIQYKGGISIGQALQFNDGLQILDLSFCGLGKKKDLNSGHWKPKTQPVASKKD